MIRRLNVQVPEKPDIQSDGVLKVVKVWPTIQGEGPFAGRPAVFVRLAGCNLKCPECDTDYTSNWLKMSPTDVITSVYNAREKLHGRSNLVVITGGEPFRQNFIPLMTSLLGNGFEVQIETNGTLFPDVAFDEWFSRRVHVVCSPKTPQINLDLRSFVSSLKYVLSAGEVDPNDGLPTRVLGMHAPPARPWPTFKGEVYVQPAETGDAEKDKANQDAAVASCLEFGYRLSVQIHKLVGVE
jgi:7-carboxy-7-deazaguanine synthase